MPVWYSNETILRFFCFSLKDKELYKVLCVYIYIETVISRVVKLAQDTFYFLEKKWCHKKGLVIFFFFFFFLSLSLYDLFSATRRDGLTVKQP